MNGSMKLSVVGLAHTFDVPNLLFPILLEIKSIRSPGPVSPRDVECEGFDFLTYPRIAGTPSSPSNLNCDVDKKVDESIQIFLMKLSQIGPELLSVCYQKSCFRYRPILQGQNYLNKQLRNF